MINEGENTLVKIGGHVSVCSDSHGYVYLVSNCAKNNISKSDNDTAKSTYSSDFDPSCKTFKLIKRTESSKHMRVTSNIISGSMSIVIENDDMEMKDSNNGSIEKYLFRFGGWIFSSPTRRKSVPYTQDLPKQIYSYVFCVYDLQEYHESTTSDVTNFKGGHSRVATEMASLADHPIANSGGEVYDLQQNKWLNDDDPYLVEGNTKFCTSFPKIPFSLGDSASVRIGQSIYIIGGYRIGIDDHKDRQGLLYQVMIYLSHITGDK